MYRTLKMQDMKMELSLFRANILADFKLICFWTKNLSCKMAVLVAIWNCFI